MIAWSGDRIPIWVEPLPGEALDSWLAAYARRLAAAEVDLLALLGLPEARFEFMVRALTSREQEAISRRTGVGPAGLSAMTLEPWNGLVITLDTKTRQLGRPPTLLHTGRYSRFCPACLDETAGRWQLSWRLPWTFACTRHNRLLLDHCPRCGNPPYINKRRIRTQAAVCIDGTGDARCGLRLSQAPSIALSPHGRVIRAQADINATVLGTSRQSATTRQRAKEISIIAQRVLRGLPTHAGTAPALVHEVLAECGGTLPTPSRRREGTDAHNTAVGAAIASTVLDSKKPEHEAVFPWLMQSNAASRTSDTYPITWTHAWYRAVGPDLATRALATVDDKVSWATRIRYGTTTSAPAWPALTEADVQQRASKVPAMLWPAWTMRVLHGAPTGHRLAGFRRGTVSLLLLPDSNWTYVYASRVLGNTLTKSNWNILTEIVDEHDCDVLTSTLVLLARALDAHRTPIDYHRRRIIFADGEVTVDPTAFRAYCRRQGRHYNEAMFEYVLWLVRHLLLGAEPGASSRSFSEHMNNSHLLDSELRGFAHEQAEANLRARDIREPLLWEPPLEWLPALKWPGLTVADIDRDKMGAQFTKRRPLAQLAKSVGVSEDHVRLFIESAGLEAPTVPPALPTKRGQGIPMPQQGILAPENLHKLYITERMSTPKIAALAGCTPATVGRLLKEAGIPLRRREGPLQAPDGTVVTAEWLEREYLQLGRTTKELAEELDCHNAYVSLLLKRHGIPTRPLFAVCSPFVRLNVTLSPAMQSVTRLRNHVYRLRYIVRLPGHHDIAAACRSLGIASSSIRYQLPMVEEAAGFTIIARTKPLTVTPEGQIFISEATRLLTLLDLQSGGKPEAPPS